MGATYKANAGGGSVSGDDDDAHHRSVPWGYLSRALELSVSNLQTIGDDEMCSVESPYSMDIGSNGKSSSSERCSSSGASCYVRSGGLGHGYMSSFRPRLLNSDELKFIWKLLRSYEGNKADHRRAVSSGYAEKGSELIQPGYDNKNDIFSLKTFVKFCQWWIPVTTTLLQIPNEWASLNHVKVQGFMGVIQANDLLLKKNLPGVFLLRFSESNPGRLVLTHTREVRKYFILVVLRSTSEDKSALLSIYKVLAVLDAETRNTADTSSVQLPQVVNRRLKTSTIFGPRCLDALLRSVNMPQASQVMSSGRARKHGSKGCPVVIRHSYVTVHPGGRWRLHYGKGMEGNSYSSLRELVNSKFDLLTLYPSSAKGNAFETS